MGLKTLFRVLKVHLILTLFSSLFVILIAFALGEMNIINRNSFAHLSLFYTIAMPPMLIISYIAFRDVLVETMGYKQKAGSVTSG